MDLVSLAETSSVNRSYFEQWGNFELKPIK